LPLVYGQMNEPPVRSSVALSVLTLAEQSSMKSGSDRLFIVE